MTDYVLVRRDALAALIEDVRAMARLCDSMVYARLMKRVHAVEATQSDEADHAFELGVNFTSDSAGRPRCNVCGKAHSDGGGT